MCRIAVLITCHNRRDMTLKCLEALYANNLPEGVSLHVILVDDGSTDGTGAAVRERFPEVEILLGDGNLYWNRGMHKAFARAMEIGFDAYLWLNDDTFLYTDSLKNLINTWKSLKSLTGADGIYVGSTQDPITGEHSYGGVIHHEKRWRFRKVPLLPRNEPSECSTMCGNCVLIPHGVAKKVGNLDPRFAHAMGDYDYGLRSRKLGLRIFVIPDYAGICRINIGNGFTDRQLSLKSRWKKIMQPKGLPIYSWLIFTRRHGGALWVIRFIWPYLRVIFIKLGSAFINRIDKLNLL